MAVENRNGAYGLEKCKTKRPRIARVQTVNVDAFGSLYAKRTQFVAAPPGPSGSGDSPDWPGYAIIQQAFLGTVRE